MLIIVKTGSTLFFIYLGHALRSLRVGLLLLVFFLLKLVDVELVGAAGLGLPQELSQEEGGAVLSLRSCHGLRLFVAPFLASFTLLFVSLLLQLLHFIIYVAESEFIDLIAIILARVMLDLRDATSL